MLRIPRAARNGRGRGYRLGGQNVWPLVSPLARIMGGVLPRADKLQPTPASVPVMVSRIRRKAALSAVYGPIAATLTLHHRKAGARLPPSLGAAGRTCAPVHSQLSQFVYQPHKRMVSILPSKHKNKRRLPVAQCNPQKNFSFSSAVGIYFFGAWICTTHGSAAIGWMSCTSTGGQHHFSPSRCLVSVYRCMPTKLRTRA
jgi:hypothetical protein